MFSNIALIAALASATSVFAHMELTYPYPFRSKYNPANGYEVIGESLRPTISWREGLCLRQALSSACSP